MALVDEVRHLKAENERLRRFVNEIKTALRPYNGTCHLDMDGRTTGEVVSEVIDAVASLEQGAEQHHD